MSGRMISRRSVLALAACTALGAVGSTSTLVTLFTGFLIGLSNGINVLVARFYGARHASDVEKTVHSAAIISAVAGVVLLLIGLLGSPAMLRLLHGGGPCRRSSGQNSSDRHSR